MAQHKYELCTMQTDRTRPPCHYPWYKERLQWKYLSQQHRQLNALTSVKWRFIPNGSDDFRSGVPPHSDDSFLKKKPALVVPIINPEASLTQVHMKRHNPPSFKPISQSTARTIYSRIGPRQQLQKERLNNLQNSLLQHPFGLYTHLEDSLSNEIAQEIIEMIDPDLKPSHDQSVVGKESKESLVIDKEEEELVQPLHEDTDCVRGNIYKWPLKKSAEEEIEEQLRLARQRAISPTQEAHVNHVTHDLVQWMRDLGDNIPHEYIDEATIKKLFASDYEAKPILTAPIHVVELSNVPPELRIDSRCGTASSRSSYRPLSAGNISGVTPKYVRTRYGAWYLKPELWKPRPWTEPLQDPQEIERKKEMEAHIKSASLDAALASTHGAKAFRDFVSMKYKDSVPEFLQSVPSGKNKLSLKKQKSVI